MPTNRRVSLFLESLTDRITPATLLAGVGAGAGPQLFKFDGTTGQLQGQSTIYGGGFSGGVRVASADVNGDSVPDTITGPGPSVATEIRVFVGDSATPTSSFLAFESSFVAGVFLATGDFNGDGKDDIVVTPDEGGGPRVRVISGADASVLADFFGIDDPNFRGGCRPAVGDVNGDGKPDLIVAAGFGGGPRVAVFDGATIRGSAPTRLFGDFFAFEQTLRNGVYVAAGDVNADGKEDLVFGGGPGGGPRVLAVDASTLLQSGGRTLNPVANFFAGDANLRGGVRVAAGDLDGDGRSEIIAGGGNGDQYLRVYRGTDFTVLHDLLIATSDPRGGVFVADPIDATPTPDPTNPDPTNPDPTNPGPTNPDPGNPTALLNGLVSYWKLDEASGQRRDSLGTNHLTGNVGQATGVIDGAAAFNRNVANRLVTDRQLPSLQTGDTDWSVSFWVYLNSKSPEQIFVAKHNLPTVEFTVFYDQATDRFKARLFHSGESALDLTASTFGAPTTGTWYNVVLAHDSTNNTATIAVNGVGDVTPHSLGVNNGNPSFSVGVTAGGLWPTDGRVDEVGFWKRALTQSDWNLLYNSGAGRTYPFAG